MIGHQPQVGKMHDEEASPSYAAQPAQPINDIDDFSITMAFLKD